MGKERNKMVVRENSGNAVYGFGLFGAAVYYVQQADGFGEVLVGLLKALAWPAFLVYELLKSLLA